MRQRFVFRILPLMVLTIVFTLSLHLLPAYVFAQMSEFTEATPSAAVDKFLSADRPIEFIDADVGVIRLSVAGDYAYASYYWGEGGGFLVLIRIDGEWSIFAAAGGAPNGGQTFVEYGVPLVDAQALWTQIELDRN